MSFMIRIPRNDFDEVAECTEAILRAGGQLMSCISRMQHSDMGMGFRRAEDYNYRYPMGMRDDRMPHTNDSRRMGMRDDDIDDPDYDMGERMGMRRGYSRR